MHSTVNQHCYTFLLVLFLQVLRSLLDMATSPPPPVHESGEIDDFTIVEAERSSCEDSALVSRTVVAPTFIDLIFQLLCAQDVPSYDVVARLQSDLEQVRVTGDADKYERKIEREREKGGRETEMDVEAQTRIEAWTLGIYVQEEGYRSNRIH